MAFHEQHERKCPTCGERISATAPKCLNCGDYVDDGGDDDDWDAEPGKPRANWVVVLGVVGVLIGAGLVVFFVRGQ